MSKQAPTPVVQPTLAYEYLNRALQLLEAPAVINSVPHDHSWIQNKEAVDRQGVTVNPESEQAVAWCTIGVIKAVTHYDQNDPQQAYKYLLSLLNMANPSLVATGSPNAAPQVNDRSNSFDTVRRMFQKAKNLALRFEGA